MIKRLLHLLHKYRNWFILACVVLLLTVFATLSLIESSRETATIDEVAIVSTGLEYLHTHRGSVLLDEPPLLNVATAASARLFSKSNYTYNIPITRENAGDWLYGNNQANTDKLVFWARLPVLVVAIILGLIIFWWAQELFGAIAGLGALAFYALDPPMIAFSHLVTYDLPLACFAAGCAYFVWKASRSNKTLWYLLAGVMLGLGLNFKISALAFALLLPLMLLPSILKQTKKFQIMPTLKSLAPKLAIIYLVAALTTWMIYSAIFGTGVLFHPVNFVSTYYHSVWVGLRGYNRSHQSFILGHLYTSGRWWFLPIDILIKSPLVLLIFLGFGLWQLIYQKTIRLIELSVFILLPVLWLLLLAIPANINIGVRYIFIVFPFLFILAGFGLSKVFQTIKIPHKAALALILVFYYSFTLVNFFPNYLGYANELAGGKKQGYHSFAHSDIDWGQGLLQLRQFADHQKIKQLQVIYWGSVSPDYYGFLHNIHANWDDRYFKFTSSVADGSELSSPIISVGLQVQAYLSSLKGYLAVPVTVANYGGLRAYNYQINGTPPYALVAGSVLVYNLK